MKDGYSVSHSVYFYPFDLFTGRHPKKGPESKKGHNLLKTFVIKRTIVNRVKNSWSVVT